jgi:TadE-like protein
MTKPTKARAAEKGSALVEFVLCFGIFWVPLFLGTLTVGFNLIAAVQVTQVCRDAAHMYSQGIDFSQSTYKSLLVSLAPSLGMAATGGKGEVILSTVTFVDRTDCAAAGISDTNCGNINKHVVTRRIVIGNSGTGFPTSLFGTPSSGLLDSSGNVKSSSGGVPYYLTDSSTQAPNFPTATGITLTSQHYAYTAETSVQSPYWTSLGTSGIAARSIF